ncbi:hypothetical protein P5V15_012769 [Pogonomyrmex californicus]
MSSPREVLLHYPLPTTVRCPRCWLSESAPSRVKGEYYTIWYACGVYGLRGTGGYPQRTVKAHYEAVHAQSPRVDAPGPSTRGTDTVTLDSDSGGESGVTRKTCAANATARLTAAADRLTRRRAADPRPPRLRSTATPSPSTAPTPPANEASPSYAAVTAGTTVTKRSSPVTSGVRGAAATRKAAPCLSPTSGGGAAARRTTRTTTAASTSKCRVLSVDKVDAPIRMATTTSAVPAVPSASRSTARGQPQAASVGMRFNPAKCATLHIDTGGCGRVLPTSFSIQDQPVRHLAEGEPYIHLGVPPPSGTSSRTFARWIAPSSPRGRNVI